MTLGIPAVQVPVDGACRAGRRLVRSVMEVAVRTGVRTGAYTGTMTGTYKVYQAVTQGLCFS